MSQPVEENALMAAFKRATAGKWYCPACMTHTPFGQPKCASCNADKPGTAGDAAKPPAPPKPPPSSGGLFGAPSNAQPPSAAGIFGQPSSEGAPTFNFGQGGSGDAPTFNFGGGGDKPADGPPKFDFGSSGNFSGLFGNKPAGNKESASQPMDTDKPSSSSQPNPTTTSSSLFGGASTSNFPNSQPTVLFGGSSQPLPNNQPTAASLFAPKNTPNKANGKPPLGVGVASPMVGGTSLHRPMDTPSVALGRRIGNFAFHSPAPPRGANASQPTDPLRLIPSSPPDPDPQEVFLKEAPKSPVNAKGVKQHLDPHRSLPAGGTIVMTCGTGSFAQLGLGEDDSDFEDDEAQQENTSKQMDTEPKDFTANVDKKKKGKKSLGKWPAPKVAEAQTPIRVPGLDGLDLVYTDTGPMTGAALTKDGRCFMWGGNDHQILGHKGDDAWVPVEITKFFPEGTKIKKVTCGQAHTFFLTQDGKVFLSGLFKNDGWEGAYYDPITKKFSKCACPPKHLPYAASANRNATPGKLPTMTDIASGNDHALMLADDGHIWEMGVTVLGQRASRRNQHLYLQPRRIALKKQSTKFKAVRCGSHYNMAISADGDLYTWGQNNYLQCGTKLREKQSNKDLVDLPNKVDFGDDTVKVLDAGGGNHTTVVLDTSGRVWSFGRNASFELGRDTVVPPSQMVAGEMQKFANEPKPGLPAQVKALDEFIVRIGVGANHWFAVDRNSTVYAVGFNGMYRTGVGLDEGSARFVRLFRKENLQGDFELVDVSASFDTSSFILRRTSPSAAKPPRKKKRALDDSEPAEEKTDTQKASPQKKTRKE